MLNVPMKNNGSFIATKKQLSEVFQKHPREEMEVVFSIKMIRKNMDTTFYVVL